MGIDYTDGPRDQPWMEAANNNFRYVERRGWARRSRDDGTSDELYFSVDCFEEGQAAALVTRLNRLDALEAALLRLADAVEAEKATDKNTTAAQATRIYARTRDALTAAREVLRG